MQLPVVEIFASRGFLGAIRNAVEESANRHAAAEREWREAQRLRPFRLALQNGINAALKDRDTDIAPIHRTFSGGLPDENETCSQQ